VPRMQCPKQPKVAKRLGSLYIWGFLHYIGFKSYKQTLILEPEKKLSIDELYTLQDLINNRLNIAGYADYRLRIKKDKLILQFDDYNKEDIKNILTPNSFEAKINNEVIFQNNGRDITYICRSADCSGIDPVRGCNEVSEGNWTCGFRFSVFITPEAAERMAEYTKNLEVIFEN